MNKSIKITMLLLLAFALLLLVPPTFWLRFRAVTLSNSLYSTEGTAKPNFCKTLSFYKTIRHLTDRHKAPVAREIFLHAYEKKSPQTRLRSQHTLGIVMSLTHNILAAIPRNAIIVSSTDNLTFPLLYKQLVEDMRPDVILLDTRFWHDATFRKLFSQHIEIQSIDTFESPFAAAKTLASTFPIFVCENSKASFPPESLYVTPLTLQMYSTKHIPDTSLAYLCSEMLACEDFTPFNACKPTTNSEEYLSTRIYLTGKDFHDVVKLFQQTKMDSLLQHFDSYYDTLQYWDAFYLLARLHNANAHNALREPWASALAIWLRENPRSFLFDDVLAQAEFFGIGIDK